jgi:hypothetical protein
MEKRVGKSDLSDDERAEAFRAALLRDLRPVGALQAVIAERVILGMWRSLRGTDTQPRRLRVCWIDPQTKAEIECIYDGVDHSESVSHLGAADIARLDASIARQLRRDLEQLGIMQGRVIGQGAARKILRSKSTPRP